LRIHFARAITPAVALPASRQGYGWQASRRPSWNVVPWWNVVPLQGLRLASYQKKTGRDCPGRVLFKRRIMNF